MLINMLFTGMGLGVAAHAFSQIIEPPLVLTMRIHAVGFVGITGLLWKSKGLPLWKSLTGTLLLSIAYAVVFTSSIIVYRLYLHRLRRFPGEMIHKLTMLSWLPIDWEGRRHTYTQTLHTKYGPIVRTGPRELSITDVQSLSSLYDSRLARRNRGLWYTSSPTSNIPQIEPSHVQYNSMSKSLSTEARRECDVVLLQCVEQCMARLKKLPVRNKGKTEDVDIAEILGWYAWETAGLLCTGKRLDFSEEATTTQPMIEVLDERIRMFNTVANVPYCIEAVRLLPSTTKEFEGWVVDAVSSKKETPIVIGPLQSKLGQQWTKDQLISETSLSILYTSSIARSTLMWCVFELAQQPKLSTRLQKEVRDAQFNLDDSSRLEEFPFLNACIKETLRLWPPLPSGQQVVTPSQGLNISSTVKLPSNVVVSVPTYTIHRDESNFSSPNEFIPARWLTTEEITQKIHTPEAFVPFGYGKTRDKVQETVLMMQCRILLARLFQSYTITLSSENTAEAIQSSYRDQHTIAKAPFLVNLCPQ
jgi:hypothetical protein